MTQTKQLENAWAWSQIEAYVDGSLDDEDTARMRATVSTDERLARAVARAHELGDSLRALPDAAVPRGLLWRLLRIPRAARAPRFLTAAPLAAAALAVSVAVWVGVLEPQAPDPRAEALRDFRIAMNYLQKTAEVARDEVNGALALGMSEALTVSRDVVLDDETDNGD